VCPKIAIARGEQNRYHTRARVMNDIERSPFAQQFRPGRSIALNRTKSYRRGEAAFAASRRARTTMLSVVDLFPKRFHCTWTCEFRDDESEKVQREESTERVPAFEKRTLDQNYTRGWTSTHRLKKKWQRANLQWFSSRINLACLAAIAESIIVNDTLPSYLIAQ